MRPHVILLKDNADAQPAAPSATGDFIIVVADFVVAGIDDLHRALTERRIVHPVRVDVIRGPRQFTVSTIPAKSPA